MLIGTSGIAQPRVLLMERYYPRAGLTCTLLSLPMWLTFLLNGVLGFFPAVIFADGGMGSKFHFWYFIKDRLFGGSDKSVWSDAGVMTGQEWIMLALALPLTIGALYCLRQRPEFGSIESGDVEDQRAELEISVSAANTKGTGNENTAAIIDSVISKPSLPDESVVSAALGEMGVIAAANAAAEGENAESEEIDALEPVHDSRFTTIIGNEDVMEMASVAADESTPVPSTQEDVEDDPFDGWPEVGRNQPEPELVPESKPEPEPAPEPATEVIQEEEEELPEMEPAKKISMPSIAGIAEKISAGSNKAAEVSVSAVKGVASIATKVKDKIVHTVRKPRPSVMPVRPEGLPPMAEWDATQEAWTLLGRPIKVVTQAEPEPEKPAWATNDIQVITEVEQEEPEEEEILPLLEATPISTPSTNQKSKRNIPKIPKIF